MDGSGKIWFPESDTLAYYNPSGKSLVDAVIFAGGGPWFIVVDGVGRLWSTLVNSNEIGLYVPTSGFTNKYPLPTQRKKRL